MIISSDKLALPVQTVAQMSQQMQRGGYPTEIFLCSSINSSLTCACCLEVLRDPVQCPNGHLFCRDCIVEALYRNDRCPTCRCHMNVHYLSVSLLARQMIHSMPVKCSSTKTGPTRSSQTCSWTGSVQDLEKHLTHDCQLQEVKCRNWGCNAWVCRRYIKLHEKERCVQRIVSCPHCTWQMAFSEIDEHHQVCEYRPVQCENGCGVDRIPFCQLEDHYQECLMELLNCPHFKCNAACNGWVVRKDWHAHKTDVNNLLTANQALEARVTALEYHIDRHGSNPHSYHIPAVPVVSPRRNTNRRRRESFRDYAIARAGGGCDGILQQTVSATTATTSYTVRSVSRRRGGGGDC